MANYLLVVAVLVQPFTLHSRRNIWDVGQMLGKFVAVDVYRFPPLGTAAIHFVVGTSGERPNMM